MSHTRTSRMIKSEPPSASRLIALCLFLLVLFLVYINNKAANRIQEVELDNFYLKDSLALKTSIVAKGDSAYRVWMNDHELMNIVKEIIEKRKKLKDGRK